MKRYILRFVPLVIVAVIAVAIMFSLGSVAQMMFNMNGSASARALLQNPDSSEFAEDNIPDSLPDDFYVLLLGVDSSENRENGDEANLYNGSFRSDSIIAAHVNIPKKKVSLCSVERDIKTELDGHEGEWNKINAAYAFGGVELMKAEVEELIGEEIPYYAVVNMDGLAAMIDSVGGVEVDVEKAFYDNMLNAGIEESGLQTLSGYDALVYARSRYAWDEGDFARARHQREVIKALASKAMGNSDLLSLYNMANTVSQNVATNLPLNQIYELAAKMRGMDTERSIYSMMTPTTGEMLSGVSYQVMDDEQWDKVLSAFKRLEDPDSTSAENGVDLASSNSNKENLNEIADQIREGRVSHDE